MFFAHDCKAAIEAAAESSLVTHGTQEAIDACRLMSAILVGYLQGHGKKDVISESFIGSLEGIDLPNLAPEIRKLAQGSYKKLSKRQIRGTGYVVRSLETALWSFWHSDSFEEGALLAVNFGDDADTSGAIFGQIAGACYGSESIPAKWLTKLAWRERITLRADQLMAAMRSDDAIN
jgi:ADP-ribosylglycohydrolase